MAYRYFATRERKFIIADAPGHEQYTRNMVTAAAGSDAAVVLVDITKLDLAERPVRLLAQTRRHALLAHLLRVPGIVFAVNKIDAVADPQAAFETVAGALSDFAAAAGIEVAGIIPVSALRGDNVTGKHGAGWFAGPTLLELLESLPTVQERTEGDLLLPVQYVQRDEAARDAPTEGAGHQPRTLWGRIAHGRVRAGDRVQLFPSGEQATVAEVRRAGETVDGAEAGPVGRHRARPPARRLARRLDRQRGDGRRPAAVVRCGAGVRGHPRLARYRAGAGRPQVLGAPRQPLGAGAHHRHRAPARHPHAGADRRAPARRQRHRPCAHADAAAAAGRAVRRRTASPAR